MSDAQKKVKELVDKSTSLLVTGDATGALQSLREAGKISPDDAAVKAAWEKMKEHESDKTPLETSKEYIHLAGDERLGKIALQAAAKYGLSRSEVGECLDLYLKAVKRPPLGDKIIGRFLAQANGQLWLASRYLADENKVFETLWIQGDETINGFVNVLLNPTAWKSETDRLEGERGGFTLLLSKLFSPGEDDTERAMRAIARLLAVDATKLEDIIDADGLAILLTALDVDSPPALRSQATLATAKFLEASKTRGAGLLAEFMVVQIAKRTNDDLVIAFSAAAAIFPVSTAVAATMFMTDGFTLELSGFAQQTRSTRVRHAVLELLSAACVEKTCRDSVKEHFTRWLKEYLTKGKNKEDLALAALVLAKTGEQFGSSLGKTETEGRTGPNFIALFKGMLLTDGYTNPQSSFEGLAYASIQGQVKEEITNDAPFLASLLEKLANIPTGDASLFGGMNILLNLTTYTPRLSAEEQRIDDLRAYASASKPTPANPLNDDAHATARCAKLLAANAVPTIITLGQKTTPSILSLVAKTLLNLTTNLAHCARMIQQGAYDHALRCAALPTTPSTPLLTHIRHDSAHLLARLLIPTDPTLLFTHHPTRTPTTAIRALAPLLTPAPATPEPTLHALRALTNLATLPPLPANNPCDLITSLYFPLLADLLWPGAAPAPTRDAAIELLCNTLQRSGLAIARFAPDAPGAAARLQLLFAAAADPAERLQTRRAALAGLGALLQFGEIAGLFLGLQGACLETLVEGLAGAGDRVVRELGVTAVAEVLGVLGEGGDGDGEVRAEAKRRLRDAGAVRVLRGLGEEVDGGLVAACLKVLEEEGG